MNDRYVLYVAVFLSVMAASGVFILNFRQKDTIEEKINKKRSILVKGLLLICSGCLILQGFMLNRIININSVTYKSHIEPISFNIFEVFNENSYPEEVMAFECPIKTNENSRFIIENNYLFVPGERIDAVIDLSEVGIDNFSIDFDKNTSCFTWNKREYVVVNKSVSVKSRVISPTIWQDNESNVTKIYIAVPISNSEELLMYTDVTGANSEEIVEITACLEQLSKKISIADKIEIKFNGFNVNESDILLITSDTITFEDESFLSTALLSEKQRSNLKSIYTDKVFEKWQTSEKISKDSKGRKAYVYVKDGIRYNLFSKEDNFETIQGIIEFESTADIRTEE